MIISRTPFRISFFGGGTDYPVWYKENGGAVLSTSIDKYCYLTCRYLPPFFEYKHRIVYSKIELASSVKDIQHPVVKACLDFMGIDGGMAIHHEGDLPARTGLGSSSSFTVGLLHSLYALKGEMPTKERLAKEAMYVEQEMLKEYVGSQDQVAVSCGRFNKIIFNRDGSFQTTPMLLSAEKIRDLEDHLMLFFTGFSRIASTIAEKQIKNTPKKGNELRAMHQMVDEAQDILTSDRDIVEFGMLLDESWKLKRSLTDKISNPQIDEIYDKAINAGAIGGKLLGAGSGGFMILFVQPEKQEKVRHKLHNLLEVNFKFETSGSQIILFNEAEQEKIQYKPVEYAKV